MNVGRSTGYFVLLKYNYSILYFRYLVHSNVPLHTALTYHRTWETGPGGGYEGLLLPALIVLLAAVSFSARLLVS